MTLHDAGLLFGAALVGGVINSVAGGGSFVSFPALLLTGMPPINANATNTIALWPGTLASTGAYRREFAGPGKRMLIPLIGTAMAGGLIGAIVLLKTPQSTFLRLVPYLLAAATLLFIFSGPITRWIRGRMARGNDRDVLPYWASLLMELGIATYIGYFGAGAGILTLAMFALLGVESIHQMNAYKTLVVSVANGIALVTFIFARAIIWPQASLMLVAAVIGGYGGAYYAQKMNQAHVRLIVIFTGAAMSVYFFARNGF